MDRTEDLAQRFDALHQAYEKMAEDLLEAGQQLRNGGAIPQHLGESLIQLTEQHRAFVIELTRDLQARQLDHLGKDLLESATLGEISAVRKLVERQEALARSPVLKVLKRAAAIEAKGTGGTAHVAKIRSKADALLQGILGGVDPDSMDLDADGQLPNPVVALVALIDQNDELADDHFERNVKSVEQEFGGQVANLAAGRRFTLPASANDQPATPISTTPTAPMSTAPPGPIEEELQLPPQSTASTVQLNLQLVRQSRQPINPFLPGSQKPAQTKDSSILNDIPTVVTRERFRKFDPRQLMQSSVPARQAETPEPKEDEPAEVQRELTAPDPHPQTVDLPSDAGQSAALPKELEDAPESEAGSQEPERNDGSDSSNTAIMSLRQLAHDLLTKDGSQGQKLLPWLAMLEGEESAAFVTSRCVWEIHNHNALPPAAVRAAILGPLTSSETDPTCAMLSQDFYDIYANALAQPTSVVTSATALIHVAGSLGASLLAPSTNAFDVLGQALNYLPEQLPDLRSYIAYVLERSADRLPLEYRALQNATNAATWSETGADLTNVVRAWYQDAQSFDLGYARATNVWKAWLEPTGMLGNQFLTILDGGDAESLSIAALLPLQDDNSLGQLIYATDKKLSTKIQPKIAGRPIRALQRRFAEGLDILSRWYQHHKHIGSQENDYLIARAIEIRNTLLSQQSDVLSELSEFESEDQIMTTGLKACRHAVERLSSLLDGSSQVRPPNYDLALYLNQQLLRTPLILSDAMTPDESAEETLSALVTTLSEPSRPWAEVFTERLQEGNFTSAQYILKLLESTRVDDTASFRNTYHETLRQTQTWENERIDELHRLIDSAVSMTPHREGQRLELTGRLEALRFPRSEDDRSHLQRRTLAEVENAVEQFLAGHRRELKRQLKAHTSPDHHDYGRIAAVIESGNFAAAHEYLYLLSQGAQVPLHEGDLTNFSNFFVKDHASLVEALTQDSLKILSKIEKGEPVGAVITKGLPDERRNSATEMLRAWFALAASKPPGYSNTRTTTPSELSTKDIRAVLLGLGFISPEITLLGDKRRPRVNLKARPLRDRNLCPVPEYGSSAQGQYRIAFVWDTPTAEDLFYVLEEDDLSRPLLVFYFGVMSAIKRRELAALCRQQKRSLLVLDDTFMLFCCGVSGSRLAVLFETLLPFTIVEPYSITAGLVPPEMFYGRRNEVSSIIDPRGSCFIYGGRQLGKTALLRDVERSFHNPQEQRYAKWVDLKAEGIGSTRSPEEIWEVLFRELKKLGIVGKQAVKPERLIERIESHLAEDSSRRILLLLDEADNFLEADARDRFIRTSEIKNVMDRTERRFKVVFAGLHNVQRTTRQGNNPLAHYGEPLCIGPYLEGDDMREGYQLILKPFSSMGYTFASSDLPVQILSRTNYYPSLIQLYCYHLLRLLTQSHSSAFEIKSSPPYVITQRHLERVSSDLQLKRNVQQRFDLTLQLDQRYEVIAYCLARGLYENSEDALVSGFTPLWIRNEAITWWPEGFKNTVGEDAFLALLEEMVGLGVLRYVDGNKFALRSPSVNALLGDKDKIESVLLRERVIESPFQPDTFRSYLTVDGIEGRWLSSFTVQQDAILKLDRNGVVLVRATEATGSENILESLRRPNEEVVWPLPDDVRTRAQFEAFLNSTSAERPRSQTTLILVPDTTPWQDTWLQSAITQTDRLKSKDSYLRIIFVSCSSLTTRTANAEAKFTPDAVQTLRLTKWSSDVLHQWLVENSYGSLTTLEQDKIEQVTGNWPFLIEWLHRHVTSEGSRGEWDASLAKLDATLHDKVAAQMILPQFGIISNDHRLVLRELAEYDEASVDDLADLLSQSVAPEVTKQTLEWASGAMLVAPGSSGTYKLDPTVRRVIDAAGN